HCAGPPTPHGSVVIMMMRSLVSPRAQMRENTCLGSPSTTASSREDSAAVPGGGSVLRRHKPADVVVEDLKHRLEKSELVAPLAGPEGHDGFQGRAAGHGASDLGNQDRGQRLKVKARTRPALDACERL